MIYFGNQIIFILLKSSILYLIIAIMKKLSLEEQKKLKHDLNVNCTGGGVTNKIQLIKVCRQAMPGLGLAEAKNLVEDCMHQCEKDTSINLYSAIFSKISEAFTPIFSKAQFMGLLEQMIDDSETFFMDPLEAVIHGCNNLKAKGGLSYVAEKDEKLIDSI